jgi:polar amino acid transport system substrate-binding protein
MEIFVKSKDSIVKFLFLYLWVFASAYAEIYTAYTEQLPPYNFLKDGKIEGKATELLKKMLKKNGDALNGQIQFGPWAKGYQSVLNNKNTILYSTARTRDREFLFKWVGPIDILTIGLIAKKSKKIVIPNSDFLHHYKIAAMYETAAESLLFELGIKPDELDRFTNIYTQMRKLHEERIDAVAFSIESMKQFILEAGLNPDEYETVYVLKESELYFAFNKDTSESQIDSLNKILKTLKQEK